MPRDARGDGARPHAVRGEPRAARAVAGRLARPAPHRRRDGRVLRRGALRHALRARRERGARSRAGRGRPTARGDGPARRAPTRSAIRLRHPARRARRRRIDRARPRARRRRVARGRPGAEDDGRRPRLPDARCPRAGPRARVAARGHRRPAIRARAARGQRPVPRRAARRRASPRAKRPGRERPGVPRRDRRAPRPGPRRATESVRERGRRRRLAGLLSSRAPAGREKLRRGGRRVGDPPYGKAGGRPRCSGNGAGPRRRGASRDAGSARRRPPLGPGRGAVDRPAGRAPRRRRRTLARGGGAHSRRGAVVVRPRDRDRVPSRRPTWRRAARRARSS